MNFSAQRDAELLLAFKSVVKNSPYIRLAEILPKVANMPSKRFWVSAERAAIVIGMINRGNKLDYMSHNKREMFFEIYHRYRLIKRRHPEMSITAIATEVVLQPAPKFYLSPGSAGVMLSKIRKAWKKKIKF